MKITQSAFRNIDARAGTWLERSTALQCIMSHRETKCNSPPSEAPLKITNSECLHERRNIYNTAWRSTCCHPGHSLSDHKLHFGGVPINGPSVGPYFLYSVRSRGCQLLRLRTVSNGWRCEHSALVGKAEVPGEKSVPLPLCPPRIPHGLFGIKTDCPKGQI